MHGVGSVRGNGRLIRTVSFLVSISSWDVLTWCKNSIISTFAETTQNLKQTRRSLKKSAAAEAATEELFPLWR